MDETQTQQALLIGYNAAPKPVQEFIRSGKFTEFIQALQTKLSIHIDVVDKVSNELLLVLLGLSDATELPDNLVKTGLDDELIEPVIDGVTTVVFKPLREDVLKLGSMPAPLPPQKISQPQVPPISFTASAPPPASWPPKPEVVPPPTAMPITPASRPEPPSALRPTPLTTPPIPKAPTPPPAAPMPVPLSVPQTVTSPPPPPTLPSMPKAAMPSPSVVQMAQPPMRTMEKDVAQLPNKQTSVSVQKPPPPAAPLPPKPLSVVGGPAYAAVPLRPPVLSNTPAPVPTPPSKPTAPLPPPVPSSPPSSPTPSAEEVASGLKQYGVDPYREPVE